ncbi:UNVERIFIED_CONTAM: hypothetical protein NCL1_19768 [Trichonephila clavipes]
MDRNPDNVSASETTPLLEQEKPDISSSKNTTVPRSTSRYKPPSTRETSLDETAGPSRHRPTAPEITQQRSTTETTEERPCDLKRIVGTIFLTLWIVWPLLFLAMGVKYFGKCPAISSLPLLAILAGLFGFIPIFMQAIQFLRPNSDWHTGMYWKYTLLVQEVAFAVIFAAYNYFLYSVKPSFDSTREDYCNRDFYNFNFFLNVLSLI